MVMPKKTSKTINVQIPPLTDTNEMLGTYANLFIARGITHCIPFVSTGRFTHPIPESATKLLNDFMLVSEQLHQLTLQYKNLEVVDARVTGKMAIFVISMEETPENVFIPEQY